MRNRSIHRAAREQPNHLVRIHNGIALVTETLHQLRGFFDRSFPRKRLGTTRHNLRDGYRGLDVARQHL